MLVAAACLFLLRPAVAAAQEISTAEKLLFETNQLGNVKGPQTLRYSYVRRGSLEPAFDDEVKVDVGKKGADGKAPVSAHFLSGDKAVEIPPVTEAEGNPALLGFLERDIREMKRLTGGSVNYFRKRIRLALAGAADVKPVTVRYGDHDVHGSQVTITPYRDDPMHDKFPKYQDKRYEFVLVDAVPGTLYRVRSVVPQEGKSEGGKTEDKNGGAPLIEETMTFAGKGSAS
ncbi:MAG: hypothetical protein ACTHL1_06690 [Burkholderiaceae bacterium]